MTKFLMIGLICPSILLAGVDVHVNVGVPAPVVVVDEPEVVFEERPVVVEASPGIYVVPNMSTEIFFVSGIYWTRHGNHWYKCHGPHKRWVKAKHAPKSIAYIPRGKYKHWNPGKHKRHYKQERHEGHHNHRH